MIGVKVTQKGNVSAVLKSLPANVRGSARKALRDTLGHVRAGLVRETVSKYYVTASKLRKAMTVRDTSIKVSGARQGIEQYKIRPTRPSKPRQRELFGAVKKGALKSLSKGAFLMWNGHANGRYIAMMREEGEPRLNIYHIIAPALPQVISNPETIETVEEDMEAYFYKRLEYWAESVKGVYKF